MDQLNRLNGELERLESEVQRFRSNCAALHSYQAAYLVVCQAFMNMAGAGAAQPQVGDSLDRHMLESVSLPPL
ncbi:uncharacterized protein AMSG_06163 [Thecamonas trahens ATCC 50062]|uniref:Uncharacterized protein n=1 Tax=Thecamonas trahens ATCC 50062 TaxID=461836 RepID=A0A0L0DCA6_THETB|nr:hypothetical protein AMSG_06163 [Thecamonas trahens ATCC 50062]KNC49870.1 hypothetical protein AMSG_06163 [Thecamonas trahens ATCC 50062]|eukprot:XP_013757354.1 hypothetical protein AMSG_06163 [Thecamonas trahens ATCC 50062]